MNVLAHSFIFWTVLIVGLLGLYILPTVIAAIRGVEGLGWILVINLLPTGVGWLAALIGAIALPSRHGTDAGLDVRLRAFPPGSTSPKSTPARVPCGNSSPQPHGSRPDWVSGRSASLVTPQRQDRTPPV